MPAHTRKQTRARMRARRQARPEWQENFNGAMHSVDALSRAALVADCDWRRFSRFLDVGGAYGSVLNALLLSVPAATGGLCAVRKHVRQRKGCVCVVHLPSTVRLNCRPFRPRSNAMHPIPRRRAV